MIEFSIYLVMALCSVFPILRAGLVKQGFSPVNQTAMMFVSLVVWVGLIWYMAPPTHPLAALVVIIIVFEAALLLSTKLLSRWQSLGHLS